MIVQFVKFKSGLSDAQVRQTIEERAPEFRALPGLLQKYYLQDKATGEYAGVYIWDSEESMQLFRQSDLARSIPAAYQVEASPKVEVYDMVTPLRSEVKDVAIL